MDSVHVRRPDGRWVTSLLDNVCNPGNSGRYNCWKDPASNLSQAELICPAGYVSDNYTRASDDPGSPFGRDWQMKELATSRCIPQEALQVQVYNYTGPDCPHPGGCPVSHTNLVYSIDKGDIRLRPDGDIPPLPDPLAKIRGFHQGGQVNVCAGVILGQKPVDNDICYQYDPAHGRWQTELRSLLSMNFSAQPVNVLDNVYAIKNVMTSGGSQDEAVPLVRLYEFPREKEAWAESEAAPLGSRKAFECAEGMPGGRLVFYTHSSGTKRDTLEIFDVRSDVPRHEKTVRYVKNNGMT